MSRFRPPRDRRGRFVNWSRTVTTAPSTWHEPESEDEIGELVRDAARTGRRMRVVGAGHSWSAIAAPHDMAVSLDRLAGVIALDPAGGTATVRGGTRLHDLNDHLARLGFALPIVGSIADQSIAGAIATGTHGSSLTHGNLSSLVRALRLVTGRGETLDLAAGDARLDGARVHLGALGVVTRVTLPIEPAFRLAETVDNVPVAAAARGLAEIAASAE
ncbi:MAG TPA: FAD-binding protein, partial [Haliangiales bacterium]|nr:FAD-binding protein [Haliangiales bacterium]